MCSGPFASNSVLVLRKAALEAGHRDLALLQAADLSPASCVNCFLDYLIPIHPPGLGARPRNAEKFAISPTGWTGLITPSAIAKSTPAAAKVWRFWICHSPASRYTAHHLIQPQTSVATVTTRRSFAI